MPDRDALDRPPVVLIANDQEWSARSLESILSPAGYAVLRAYNGEQALDLARATQPDLVFLDERMPDLRGIEVCRRLRTEARLGDHTPILLVTADSPVRDQVLAGLAAGAWDYVHEPLDAESLLLRMATYVRAKRAADRMRDESLLDAATGLYNVRGLSRRAREIGAEASRQGGGFACVALAPDADPSSRDAGETDRLAEHVGGLLRRAGRASDAIGRLGRTEFAIVAPATEEDGAARLVQRLQDLADAQPLTTAGGTPRPIRLRAGYATVRDLGPEPPDADEVLVRAATALRAERAIPAFGGSAAIQMTP